MRYLASIIAFCIVAGFGCAKSEGLGGKATVTGTLKENVYNILGYQHTIGAQGKDIHVIYGSAEQIADDKIETGYTGKFEINYLRPGDYTVYAYSDCFTCLLGADSVVLASFSITSKSQELDLGDIFVVDRN